MKVFKVIVGEYGDKQYYLVRGAKDAAGARSQVKAWHEENYGESVSWDFDLECAEVVEITLGKGVTRL